MANLYTKVEHSVYQAAALGALAFMLGTYIHRYAATWSNTHAVIVSVGFMLTLVTGSYLAQNLRELRVLLGDTRVEAE